MIRKRAVAFAVGLLLLLPGSVAWGDCKVDCIVTQDACHREPGHNCDACDAEYRECVRRCGIVEKGTSGPACGRPGQTPCLDKKGKR